MLLEQRRRTITRHTTRHEARDNRDGGAGVTRRQAVNGVASEIYGRTSDPVIERSARPIGLAGCGRRDRMAVCPRIEASGRQGFLIYDTRASGPKFNRGAGRATGVFCTVLQDHRQTQTRRQSTSIQFDQAGQVVHSLADAVTVLVAGGDFIEDRKARLGPRPRWADLPAVEAQAGRRVSLRQTQLEGTCRPCTTYSRVASTRSVASSRRRADGQPTSSSSSAGASSKSSSGATST